MIKTWHPRHVKTCFLNFNVNAWKIFSEKTEPRMSLTQQRWAKTGSVFPHCLIVGSLPSLSIPMSVVKIYCCVHLPIRENTMQAIPSCNIESTKPTEMLAFPLCQQFCLNIGSFTRTSPQLNGLPHPENFSLLHQTRWSSVSLGRAGMCEYQVKQALIIKFL